MTTCPYCDSPLQPTARTCPMCGTGVPATTAASGSRLTIVLTILVVLALFAGAFLYGKWQADVTPMNAAVPSAAPVSKEKRPARATPTPTPTSPDPNGRP
jgi:hypothetical protein